MTDSKQHTSPELIDLAELLTRHDVGFDWDDASDPWMRNRLVEFADALLRLEEQLEALQRERDEVIRPAVLDTVAEYRAQVEGLQEQLEVVTRQRDDELGRANAAVARLKPWDDPEVWAKRAAELQEQLEAFRSALDEIAHTPSGRQKVATLEGYMEADGVMRTIAHNALEDASSPAKEPS